MNSTLMCRSLHAADYDNDGFTDLYVVNINNVNHFYKNDGGTGFTNVYQQTGTLDTGVGMGSIFSITTTMVTRICTSPTTPTKPTSCTATKEMARSSTSPFLPA